MQTTYFGHFALRRLGWRERLGSACLFFLTDFLPLEFLFLSCESCGRLMKELSAHLNIKISEWNSWAIYSLCQFNQASERPRLAKIKV